MQEDARSWVREKRSTSIAAKLMFQCCFGYQIARRPHSIHRLQETKAADRCLGCHVHSDTRWQRAVEMLETWLY